MTDCNVVGAAPAVNRLPSCLTQSVAIVDILIEPNRMRRLQPDVVEQLAESIAKRGVLQPILLRRRGSDGQLVLVAGHHRIEAVKCVGETAIPAIILDDLNAAAALLAEIDENLIRADLTPAERALHIGERKSQYEKLYPETKHGGAPGKVGGGKKAKGTKLGSFAAETAKATGRSKTAVKRDATRAEKVKVLDQIAGTSLDKGDELDALAKLPEAEQRALAQRVKGGEQVSAKKLTTTPVTPPTMDQAIEKASPPNDSDAKPATLATAWAAAGADERMAHLDALGREGLGGAMSEKLRETLIYAMPLPMLLAAIEAKVPDQHRKAVAALAQALRPELPTSTRCSATCPKFPPG